MFNSTYRLLKLFSHVDQVRGRKKLQKMVHLISAAGGPFTYKYQYHHFGPYSADLQAEVNEMVERGFLTEQNEDRTYVYALTEKGRAFMERLEQEESFHCQLKAETIRDMSEESSSFLEMVSTYTFLIESGDSPEQAKKKAVELKSHLGECIDEAADYYEQYVRSS